MNLPLNEINKFKIINFVKIISVIEAIVIIDGDKKKEFLNQSIRLGLTSVSHRTFVNVRKYIVHKRERKTATVSNQIEFQWTFTDRSAKALD